METSPIRLEIFRHLLTAIAEEMGVALCRASYSPNIKERRDFSCAIFDAKAEMIAQAAHIPVHLGAMPLSVRAAVDALRFERGDVVILNDPYCGGTHLPDITLISPVFRAGEAEPILFVANRAHHADVGGAFPGSLSLSTDIYQEGIRIPPVKLVAAGRQDETLLGLILRNVRTPAEREGDIAAQSAANDIGTRRCGQLLDKYGNEALRYAGALQDYAEQLVRDAIRRIPDGVYTYEDRLDDDGVTDAPVPIVAAVTVEGDSTTVDFTGSAAQVRGSVNAVYAVTVSAVAYVFRTLVPGDAPLNAGTMRPITVLAPEGTVVNAQLPAAVAAGNVEASQRIVDVVFGALASALPDTVPAASYGTMSNVTLGGTDPRTRAPFAYYETIAGGMGARPSADGLDGVHCHMTNTLNTPIEALEFSAPVRVLHYAVRRGSGGSGKWRGGDGLRRDIQVLADCEMSIMADRHRFGPYGLAGGDAGKPGRSLLLRGDAERELPSKCNLRLERGDIVSIRTPGGGGWGEPARQATTVVSGQRSVTSRHRRCCGFAQAFRPGGAVEKLERESDSLLGGQPPQAVLWFCSSFSPWRSCGKA